MSDFGSLFGQIANAKPVGQFLPRLPTGTHLLVLTKYMPKASQTAMGTILEADFMVLRGGVPQGHQPLGEGEKRGWAWFPNAQGWSGTYEQGRAKNFIEAVVASVASTWRLGEAKRDLEQAGNDLAGAQQVFRGLQMTAEVTPQLSSDGQAKRNKKGQPMFDIVWKVVPQTMAEVAAMRAELDKIDGAAQAQSGVPTGPAPAPYVAPAPAPAPYVAPAPAPYVAPAPAATTGALGGLLAGLRKG